MGKNERHVEALSPECEAILDQRGMHSLGDQKNESAPADIFTSDGELVLTQVPRDIPPYYLDRLLELGLLALGNQQSHRLKIDSEIKVFRKRLKVICDHYESQEIAAWVEIEDMAKRATIRLGRIRNALEDLSDEFSGVEKRVRQMVAIEREHNTHRARVGQPEVSACHDLLEELSSSSLKKLS
ncbi:hypothetical protein [Acidovorax facilis]|uniref:hypothetical protein n=1 Tax=Acidovorax facilis TaxID=12917 RepID=UPI003D656A2F